MREFAEAAATMLRRQQADAAHAEAQDGVEEVALTTCTRCELIRLMPCRAAFVLLVFDLTQTNLVMARLELERFMLEFSAL